MMNGANREREEVKSCISEKLLKNAGRDKVYKRQQTHNYKKNGVINRRNKYKVYLPGWSDSTITQVERLERSGAFAHKSVE